MNKILLKPTTDFIAVHKIEEDSRGTYNNNKKKTNKNNSFLMKNTGELCRRYKTGE